MSNNLDNTEKKLQGVSHHLGLGVKPEKKFHYIFDIYGFHIYWYVLRVQGCQLFIDPNWRETPCRLLEH